MSQFWGKPQEAIRGTPKRGCHLTYTSVFHILESQKTVLVKKIFPILMQIRLLGAEKVFLLLISYYWERDKGDVWPMLGCAALSRTTLVKMSHTVWIQASEPLLQSIFFFPFLFLFLKHGTKIAAKLFWRRCGSILKFLSQVWERVKISSGEMFLWCKQGDALLVSSGFTET